MSDFLDGYIAASKVWNAVFAKSERIKARFFLLANVIAQLNLLDVGNTSEYVQTLQDIETRVNDVLGQGYFKVCRMLQDARDSLPAEVYASLRAGLDFTFEENSTGEEVKLH